MGGSDDEMGMGANPDGKEIGYDEDEENEGFDEEDSEDQDDDDLDSQIGVEPELMLVTTTKEVASKTSEATRRTQKKSQLSS